jgi:hypothetical protein
LLQRQEEYYDIPTSTLTPIQIREKLASLFAETGVPRDRVETFKELLKLKSTPNGGVSVTDELKYTSKPFSTEYGIILTNYRVVKFSRQNGVHVSPSVLWDGILANEVSSSWGEAEWTQFFAQKVAV